MGMMNIKYKAWDKKSKKIRDVESIGFGILSVNKEGYPVVNLKGRDCINDKDILLHRENGEYELLQFTGIKDKNGVEVYKGNVIKYTHKTIGIIMREVVFKYGCYGIEGNVLGTHIPFGNILNTEIEVIGWIYERL
ncbi:hypothetical protein DVV91_17050 [Clostridium botulinum]|nr:hypothetical protein [Clostridium botulinum]